MRDAGNDWRINIDQAWMDISYRSAIQGNLDPAVLMAPLPELKMRVHELLKRTGSRPGHIFNLGHGILPETPVENVKACVEIVRDFRSRAIAVGNRVLVIGGGISGLSVAGSDLTRAGRPTAPFLKNNLQLGWSHRDALERGLHAGVRAG